MPNRIVRDGILTSERVDALSMGAELFYRRLMSVVDDYGRYEGRPALLLSACFPCRSHDGHVTVNDVTGWLLECGRNDGPFATHGPLVAAYEVNGRQYIEITGFNQRVRVKRAKFPPPDGHMTVTRLTDDGHMTVNGRSYDGLNPNPNPKKKEAVSVLVPFARARDEDKSSHMLTGEKTGRDDDPISAAELVRQAGGVNAIVGEFLDEPF